MASKFREILACDVDLIGQKSDNSDIQGLVAFLLSLTDPCVKGRQCMQPWLLDKNNQSLPESMLLEARTASGQRL